MSHHVIPAPPDVWQINGDDWKVPVIGFVIDVDADEHGNPNPYGEVLVLHGDGNIEMHRPEDGEIIWPGWPGVGK